MPNTFSAVMGQAPVYSRLCLKSDRLSTKCFELPLVVAEQRSQVAGIAVRAV